MHKALQDIQQQLEKIITQVRSAVPNDEPLGIAHGQWSYPNVTRTDLIEEAQSLIDLIDNEGGDEVGEHEAQLGDYIRRLQFLNQSTIPNIWGNPAAGVPAYIFTLQTSVEHLRRS